MIHIIAVFGCFIMLILFVIFERVINKKLKDGERDLEEGSSKLLKYDRFPLNIFIKEKLKKGYNDFSEGFVKYSKGLLLHRVMIVAIILTFIIFLVLTVGFFV